MIFFFPRYGFTVPTQGLFLKKIVILTDKLDSLDRSFTKKGFTIISGARDPVGFFSDTLRLSNGQMFVFKMPFAALADEKEMLHEYGAVITDIKFSVQSLDSVRSACERDSIDFTFDTMAKTITLLNTKPLRLSIIEGPRDKEDTVANHPNGVFRIDWVLLSASADVEKKLRRFLSALEIRAFHEGCCDYWRIGTQDDFTMIRFEPPLKMKPAPSGWLGVEGGNIYFAY